MAHTALQGAAMQPSDDLWWPRIKAALKFIGWEALLSFLICLVAGLTEHRFSQDVWRDFMLAGAVLVTSRLSAQRFFWLLQSSPTMNALWQLPVAGQDICRWARASFLRDSLKLLPRMLVTSWAWQGFPLPAMAWPQIVWNGILLWLVMVACVMHDSARQGLGRAVVKVWSVALVAWGGLLIYAWWWEKSHQSGQPLADWALALCGPMSWLLPAKWAMHSADGSTALSLTLLCLLSGGFLWWFFPARTAIAYDLLIPEGEMPPPDAETIAANSLDEESDPAETAATSDVPSPPPIHVLEAIQQAEVDEHSLIREGWIEKLALRLMNKRDREIAAILTGLEAGWTRRWWKAARTSFLLLFAALLLVNFGTRWVSFDAVEIWIVILPLLVVAFHAFPLSNNIPIAMLAWPLGLRSMPFFAGLPLSVRDLMRISRCITLARVVACMTLLLPVIIAQCFILGHTRGIPVLCGIAVALSALWIFVRPLFIYYRLQQVSSPARGFRFGHFMAYLLILPMGLVAAISAVMCVAMVLFCPLWLPLAACCAEGIFALFHWRVRTRRVDWTMSSTQL